MTRVRTRYAPSPTGYLHLGGARTALFCYLFAKHYHGDFIVRIEDTDIKREIKEGEKSQLDNLNWLGIEADESPWKPNLKYQPYRQSERLLIYQKYLKILIEQNHAYECFDNEAEIKQQMQEQKAQGKFSFRYDRNWLQISEVEKNQRRKKNQVSYRINLPKNHLLEWEDIVRGKIAFNTDDISEFVIMKSNGIPTYNFANVIDDHLMEMSHVFRGEEHISNTPKQLILYEIFQWEKPFFGHFTIITNEKHKKLSKRDTSVKQFIEQYRDEKYPPQAIVNYMSMLGWTPAKPRDIISKDELIKEFDEKRWSRASAMFDYKKLTWLANQYFQKMDMQTLKDFTLDFIAEEIKDKSLVWVNTFLETYQKQLSAGIQIKNFFELTVNKSMITNEQKNIIKKNAKGILSFQKLVEANKEFSVELIKNLLSQAQKISQCKGRNFYLPLRLALTGQEHGPELYNVIFLIGKEQVIERINKWEN